jgi:hypothetical protein
MQMLDEKEKQEWMDLSRSRTFKEDMRYLQTNRHNPFLKDGNVDMDKLIEFLTLTNEFYNHRQKPFMPIIDTVMKL